jgi:iron complex outermembrane receptor protein
MAAVLLAPSAAVAQDAPSPPWMRGLDELMSVQVTSVSKKEQRLEDTASAVYVLTRDDIRRSGMRTIPDLLRLVPGMDVAQLDGNKWAISARGMNSRWANKLLVMIDGRSVYTPYFAGTFWDSIDVPIQAIERIEVIRGPGASIWGANAVNGVINIITTATAVKDETEIAIGAGSDTYASALHDGRVGDRVGYRVFADGVAYAPLQRTGGIDAGDNWGQRRAGGSFHATLNGRDAVDGTAQISSSRSHWTNAFVQNLVPFTTVTKNALTDSRTWSATGQWTRQLRDHGQFIVQGAFDQWWRDDELISDHHRSTIDVSVQHRLPALGRNDVMWGVQYRNINETTLGSTEFWLTPTFYRHHLASAFAQDDIALANGRAHLVLGAKVEERDYLGWGVQPTARVHVRLTASQSAWAAVSRAQHAPDRVERSIRLNLAGFTLPDNTPAVVALIGNPEAKAEWLTAYEGGYRASFGDAATLDLSGYYNRYTDIDGVSDAAPQVQLADGRPYLLIPTEYFNGIDATTMGGEGELNVRPAEWVRLTAGYSLFSLDTTYLPGATAGYDIGGAPRHQGQLRASVSLPHGVDLDAAAFAVGAIPSLQIPSYTRVDAHASWRLMSHLEVSVVGQNLFGPPHREFAGAATGIPDTSLVSRTGYGALTWHF